MPFEITTRNNVLVITLRGTFTGLDLGGLFNAVRDAESRLAFSPHRLTDLTEAAGPQITHHDIANCVERLKFIQYYNPHKSAVVAPGLLQFGFARMFQMLSSNPQVEISVFRDIPTAQSWLDEVARPADSLSLA